MDPRPVPPGCAACAACGYQVARRDKTGDICISITIKPGVSITLREPICLSCALKAKGSPEASLAVLREASARMLTKAN